MMKLNKSISTWTLLSSAIAGIVGSGWLLGPLACARIAGPGASICWIIAGLLMMIVAACFVKLSSNLPITGGTVRFFQMSYGHFAGFSFSWVAWLAWIAVTPIETMALVQYSSNYIPHLMTNSIHPTLTTTGIIASIVCMTLIASINGFGTKTYSKVNQVILMFKLAIPAITAALLLSTHFHSSNFHAGGGHFIPYGIHSLFAALPMAGVIYSFIGFNPAIQMAGETKNPKRSIPIAVFGSLGICMVLYTLIQIAFIGALPASSFIHGWHTLEFTGDNAPFVGLLTGLGFVWFVKALYIDSVVSPFGTAMVQSMATARLTYAMGKNNYLPKKMTHVSKRSAPITAIIVNTLIGFLFFLPFPSWQHMVGFLVSCLVFGYIAGPMSLMILTTSDNKIIHSKISNFSMHALCLAAFYICNLMIFWSGWAVMMKLIPLFAIGYLVLAIKLYLTNNPIKDNLHIKRGSWIIVYIITIGIISYLGTFGGGHNVIPFGMDFATIAAMTIGIYWLASTLAKKTKTPEIII